MCVRNTSGMTALTGAASEPNSRTQRCSESSSIGTSPRASSSLTASSSSPARARSKKSSSRWRVLNVRTVSGCSTSTFSSSTRRSATAAAMSRTSWRSGPSTAITLAMRRASTAKTRSYARAL
eukprot:Amastigsp_a513289_12.p4 type:complete len:123 gc:universal Amastigsp_a513289_12:1086-718(-)